MSGRKIKTPPPIRSLPALLSNTASPRRGRPRKVPLPPMMPTPEDVDSTLNVVHRMPPATLNRSVIGTATSDRPEASPNLSKPLVKEEENSDSASTLSACHSSSNAGTVEMALMSQKLASSRQASRRRRLSDTSASKGLDRQSHISQSPEVPSKGLIIFTPSPRPVSISDTPETPTALKRLRPTKDCSADSIDPAFAADDSRARLWFVLFVAWSRC